MSARFAGIFAAMSGLSRIVRLLLVLALVLAGPAVARPFGGGSGDASPAPVAAAHDSHAGPIERAHCADSAQSRDGVRDAVPDFSCAGCCCVLSLTSATSVPARAAKRLSVVEFMADFASLDRSPPAPPPRA